jgi:hypothetical protein
MEEPKSQRVKMNAIISVIRLFNGCNKISHNISIFPIENITPEAPDVGS